MDVDGLIELLRQHSWVAAASVVVGGLVRASKSGLLGDLPLLGPLVARIPPKKRPYLALALGQLSALLEAVTKGTSWREAVLHGLVASAVAIMGHDLGVEALRDGKEPFTAKAAPGGKPPSPPKPPKPPTPPAVSVLALALVLGLS